MLDPVPDGALVLDLKLHTIATSHGSTYLSPQRFSIALMLAARSPMPVSCEEMVHQLWGESEDGGPGTADKIVHVNLYHIRKLLGPIGVSIIGYFARGWALEQVEPGRVAA